MYPSANDFRAAARAQLTGNRGMPLAVMLVAAVIISASGFTVVGPFLLTGAFWLGLCAFFCRTMLGERPEFVALFDKFGIFFKACGLYLFMGLFVFLWTLLLWVPGIIAAYRYSMAPYLMAEYPQMGIREAVNRSKELMAGHKGRLFCLHLSFIGWALLAIPTFGLLYLWLGPYIAAAEAAFYLQLTGKIMQPAGSTGAGADAAAGTGESASGAGAAQEPAPGPATEPRQEGETSYETETL